MGVTIHYRGHIDKKEHIDKFIVEVSDICKSMNWKYEVMDEDWNVPSNLSVDYQEEGSVSLKGHAGLKGVSFTPHEKCEPVRLTFDAKGQLNSLMNLAFSTSDKKEELPWMFSKTQFAGSATHIAIIKLLKYINKKYISDLEVRDEGLYWETENPRDVSQRMGLIDNAMNALHDGLQELENMEDLSEENIINKINEVIENIGEQEGIKVKVLRIDNVLGDLEKKMDELGMEHDFTDYVSRIASNKFESEELTDEELSEILAFESEDMEGKDNEFDEEDLMDLVDDPYLLEKLEEFSKRDGIEDMNDLEIDPSDDWEEDFLDGFEEDDEPDFPNPSLN